MNDKKRIRLKFRTDCIKRDGGCVICHKVVDLEVHHITNRNLMPNGGYCKENGITLCSKHHEDAEDGTYLDTVLYGIIDSNFTKAYQASLRIK